jgi:hypothetical protein
VLLLASGSAQEPAAPPISRPEPSVRFDALDNPHISVATSVRPAVAAPGARVTLNVDVTPKPKMHVYSPAQKGYIPVALTLDPGGWFKAQTPVFPKPESYYFAPLKETQLVYSKPFRIVQELTLGSAADLRNAPAASGALTIGGTLRYQACDDAICYLPKTLPLSWTIRLPRSAMQ